MTKKSARIRRARKTRTKIRELGAHRLCIHRTPRHIYAQVFSGDTQNVVTCVSTLDAAIKSAVKYTGNVDAAKMVGKLIAERAKSEGITSVAFDRSGFKYHGRIKALADAAREAGLEF
ncbi:50S ribosomal protein L18 [bacterium]|nr:50S ribosomal protein L18 [bacterium]